MTDRARARRLGEPLRGYPDAVRAVAFLDDGRRLVTASDDDTVLGWSLGSMNALRSDPVGRACDLAGGGLDPAQWIRYVGELELRATCPGPSVPQAQCGEDVRSR